MFSISGMQLLERATQKAALMKTFFVFSNLSEMLLRLLLAAHSIS